jgi:hypothetical protein
VSELRNFAIDKSIETVWEALEEFRDEWIPEGTELNDRRWDNVCLAMAWISEALERGEQ